MSDLKQPKRKRSPWFAFYPDDWIGGTRIMSLAGRGAYLDLLAYQFTAGLIPKDDRTICRIIGAFPEEWEAIKGEVLPKFEETEDGFVNRRLEKEAAERAEIRSKRVEAINKRWNKQDTKEIQDGYKSIDLVDTSPTTSPTTSPSDNSIVNSYGINSCPSPMDVGEKSDGPKKKRNRPTEPDGFAEFWNAVPIKIGKGAARKAWARATKATPAADIMAGLESYRSGEAKRQACQGHEYRPLHPATWLNQERWSDEAPAAASPTPPPAPAARDYSQGFWADIPEHLRTPAQIAIHERAKQQAEQKTA